MLAILHPFYSALVVFSALRTPDSPRCFSFRSSRFRVSTEDLCCLLADVFFVQDTVSVHPSQFGLPPEQAITNELNKKYANRVLHDVGLCICVFDLAEVGEGKVRYGDGCLWYKGG